MKTLNSTLNQQAQINNAKEKFNYQVEITKMVKNKLTIDLVINSESTYTVVVTKGGDFYYTIINQSNKLNDSNFKAAMYLVLLTLEDNWL
jgi:hypothetical protein